MYCLTRVLRSAALFMAAALTAGAVAAQSGEPSAIPPIESAFHVLPPIGTQTGPPGNFDDTLTGELAVIVWQVVGESDLVELARFTSASDLARITLQDDHYQVDWKIPKGLVGQQIAIHVMVADLNVGGIAYTPTVGRTLPFKFRIDNHPSIRARVLHAHGATALVVAQALVEEFQLSAPDLVRLLTDDEYPIGDIGTVLRDVFRVTPQDAARFLARTDAYSATEIGQVLIDVFGIEATSEWAGILKDAGFGASAISDALKAICHLPPSEIAKILLDIGFTAEELFAAESRDLAEMFAPQLRFDGSAWTFPMSAQEYFANSIEGNAGRLENKDYTTLNTPGRTPPPTYFKAFKVGNQIRILYWWYYGYQPGCWAFGTEGTHDGDWERAMVTLSQDMSRVVALTYFQHTGWYTRLALGGDTIRMGGIGADYGDPGFGFDGTHPIIFVGKTQHGSYHNEGGRGDGVTGLSYCFYYDDWRNNEGRSHVWLNTHLNLVSLADLEEPWMLEEASFQNRPVGVGDGAKVAFDVEFKYVIAASVKVKVDGTLLDTGWSFSNGTGAGGRDQIVFSAPPAAGTQITADLENGDFRWGCGPCEDNGISTHPVKESTYDKIATLDACVGMESTIIKDAGCFESQCENHDNQSWWSDFLPGTCSHCPAGYTDMGFVCWKGGWPWQWRWKAIHYYGLDYTISQTDAGLSRKR